MDHAQADTVSPSMSAFLIPLEILELTILEQKRVLYSLFPEKVSKTKYSVVITVY